MKNKFDLGIEISEKVSMTAVPREIKRYDNVPKKNVKVKQVEKNLVYRYRPGMGSFIKEDFNA